MKEKTERLMLRRKGLLALRRGKVDEAIELLTGCLALFPDDVPARVALGAAYSRKKWHEKALTMFERAAKIRPMSVDVHYDWAKALARAGRLRQAVKMYRRVLKLDPQHPKATRKILKIKERVRRYRERPSPPPAPVPSPVPPKSAAPPRQGKMQRSTARVLRYDSAAPPPPPRQVDFSPTPPINPVASSSSVDAHPDFAAAVQALAIEAPPLPAPVPALGVPVTNSPAASADPYAPWQPAAPAASPKKSQRRRRVLLVLAGLVLCAGGALAFWRPWQSSTAVESPEPSARNRPAAADADLVAKAIADLKSASATQRRVACELLGRMHVKDGAEELAKNLEPLLRDADGQTRAACARSLGSLGIETSVPAILAQLGNEDFAAARREEMLALGKLKDPRAIDALAQHLSRADDREAAGQALQTMGPLAEKKVLDYLRYPELPVRLEACRILEHIGSHSSIGPLEAAENDANPKVAAAAGTALQAIRGRK